MKVTIEVDCTPEEARRFLGLPDVAQFNDDLLERFRESGSAMLNPEFIAKMWFPFGGKGLDEIQKVMRSAMSGGKSGDDDSPA